MIADIYIYSEVVNCEQTGLTHTYIYTYILLQDTDGGKPVTFRSAFLKTQLGSMEGAHVSTHTHIYIHIQ